MYRALCAAFCVVVMVASGCGDLSGARQQALRAQAAEAMARAEAERAHAIAAEREAEAKQALLDAQNTLAKGNNANTLDSNPQAAAQVIRLTVPADGMIQVNEEHVELPALEEKLKTLADKPYEITVEIRADTNCKYVRVLEAFEACQKAGFRKILLRAAEENAP